MMLQELQAPCRLPRMVSKRREIARALWYQGWTYRDIGALLGRAHNTVGSYIRRDGWLIDSQGHSPSWKTPRERQELARKAAAASVAKRQEG